MQLFGGLAVIWLVQRQLVTIAGECLLNETLFWRCFRALRRNGIKLFGWVIASCFSEVGDCDVGIREIGLSEIGPHEATTVDCSIFEFGSL